MTRTMVDRDLPVLDVSALDAPHTRAALDRACREWGFFHAIGHGIDEAVTDAVLAESRAFFRLPLDEKRAISRTPDNPWGFFDRELTKNTRDWKEIFDYGPADGAHLRPQWPASGAFKASVLAFYAACEALSLRLVGAIAENLGVTRETLHASFVPTHTSFVRLNHYPRCPAPARPPGLVTPRCGHLGVNHHTDAGALTILLQDDRPGLEVLHDGAWRLVTPRRDSLVVNIGDIVQVWSNDRYRAALHRVLASSDAERFSVPFFLNPSRDASYAPLPTTIDAQHPARYRAINWHEFRARRAAGDYADLGEEIQITAYRIEED
jgi:isopenicillin N synthase-like dioxygenase